MEKLFETAANNVENLEEDLLGPDYKYYKGINSPGEIGMSDNGTMGTMVNNVAGLSSYVEILITGRGEASKTGTPLGDKYFLKTMGQCSTKDGNKVQRSLYVNNVPDGDIPLLSSALGKNFTTFEGILPGILEDIGKLNPLPLFGSFMQGAEPPCTKITMPVIDVNNNESTSSGYVTNAEIKAMNPAWFPNGKPTLEGFVNANLDRKKNIIKKNAGIINDLVKLGFGSLIIYLIYKMLYNGKI